MAFKVYLFYSPDQRVHIVDAPFAPNFSCPQPLLKKSNLRRFPFMLATACP